MSGSMSVLWTWAFLPLDALGVWLLLDPGGLGRLWTANRVRVSDTDRRIARLVGVLVLLTQFQLLVGHVEGVTLRSGLGWLLSVASIAAIAFLGYKIVRSAAAGKRRRSLVNESEWRGRAEAETREGLEARYAASWAGYRRLRIAFPLWFIGWLPLWFLLGLLFNLLGWNENIATVVVLALWIPGIPVLGWKWSNWRCPRCGYAFKGPYSPFFPKRCHYCGLPIWARPVGE